MSLRPILFLLIAVWFSCGMNAQEGSLQFIGHHFFNEKALANTQIKVTANQTLLSQFETGKSNSFKTALPFGAVYDIYFTNTACQTSFIRVFADIPAGKQNLKTTYELDIPFFANDPSVFDTAQFHRPIHQIVFDGKSRFVDDTAYMNAFLRKVLKPQPVEDTSDYFSKKPVHAKQYLQLVGRLGLDNDKQTLLKQKTVTLLNKNGGKVSSTQTSNHGIFVFQGVDSEIADGIRIELSAEDNPNKENIRLQTVSGEPIALASPVATGTCVYENSDQNQLIKKLSDKEYNYNIGGKLIVHGVINRIVSGKEVCLLNRNNLVQKTKTDVFGNFLFTKIVPGQTYSFAFDTSGYEAAPEIYTVKDKFVKRVDSVSGKNYAYQFRAESGSRFNDLLLDDSELKMSVRGRLYGENKNNPLADFKILLLNDTYKTIDSAMTDKDGDFDFSYMPYNRNLMFNADNEKDILEAFNNILVFDNSENLIKIVSTVKGSKFKYMPLSTEQSRLTEVFVDDPWLHVVNAKKPDKGKAMPVIVENILFEFDKAGLLPQSQQTLDKIILAMGINKNFSLELGAHSDSKGSDAYNLKLSEQRAAAAKSYMVNKGIDAARINAKGYGESKLLNNCNDAILCSEDEHAVNRRLEFKLIFN